MCSVEPREPPPHLTLPGSFFIWATTSFMVRSGDAAGTTKTLYSLVSRAIGVAWLNCTGGLPVMIPPTITAPIMISALGSPLDEFTNWASPRMPAAPPLLSYCTASTAFASDSARPRARPVVSQPPPGLAGIIIFSVVAARVASGRPPARARPARDLRKASRRMEVSSCGACMLMT